MANQSPRFPDRVAGLPTGKYLFGGLVLLLLVVALGQLYVLEGLTRMYFGLPLWLWLEVLVVFVMIGIAWFAIRLVAAASEEAA